MILEAIARQFRRPVGAIGAEIAVAMAAANDEDYGAALEALAPEAGMFIVEIGMAAGAYAQRIAATGALYLGIDHSSDMVALARRTVPGQRFVCMDVCEDALPSCDAVLAVNTIQWWDAPLVALANIHNALLPGGRLVIGVAVPPKGIPQVGQREYSSDDLLWMLRRAAFRQIVVQTLPATRRPYMIASATR